MANVPGPIRCGVYHSATCDTTCRRALQLLNSKRSRLDHSFTENSGDSEDLAPVSLSAESKAMMERVKNGIKLRRKMSLRKCNR